MPVLDFSKQSVAHFGSRPDIGAAALHFVCIATTAILPRREKCAFTANNIAIDTHLGIIIKMSKQVVKPLEWVGSAKKDLLTMPDNVIDVVGYALHLAQNGLKHAQAKALKGFGSAGVLEVVEDDDGNTYRAIYTVRFKNAIYVLHCFQKKSHKGISTPKHEMDVVEARLKLARQHAEGVAK